MIDFSQDVSQFESWCSDIGSNMPLLESTLTACLSSLSFHSYSLHRLDRFFLSLSVKEEYPQGLFYCMYRLKEDV